MAGLLSILGKVGAGIAAPFTGGASLAALPVLDAIGGAGTGAAGGMADERARQNQFNLGRAGLANSAYATQQGNLTSLAGLNEQATMNRAQLGLTAPTARANQMIKGSLMETLQPLKITHPRAHIPEFTGGLSAANFTPAVRAAGRTLQDQAGSALASGSDVPAPTDYASRLLPAPDLPSYKEPGKAETVTGTGGILARILAALAKRGGGSASGSGMAALGGGGDFSDAGLG